MKLLLLLALISALCFLQNVVESKKSSKKKTPKPYKKPPYPTKPSSIKYYTSKELGAQLIHDIDGTLKYLSNTTCLHFKKDSKKLYKIGINFYSNKKYSKVELSTSSKKPTKVYLRKGIKKNDLLFFIGLALGLVPEITRNDGSLNVEVIKSNIKKSNYEKYYKVKQYDYKIIANTSFDFHSVMLPSRKFKGVKGRLTYKFRGYLSKYNEKSVNDLKDFTYNDVKRLWYLHYDKCQKYNCFSGGYLETSCDKCVCPEPFAGEKCKKIRKNNEKKCGKTQTFEADLSKRNHTIEVDRSSCYYSIKSKEGKKVQFNILNFTSSIGSGCDLGFRLEVKYRNDKGATGLRLCENYTNIIFPAISSEVNLIFYNVGKNKLEFSYNEVQEN
uniref:Astacin domain-containing protein n=1 Tax=Strongyloides papillosus TaxID=174720 RepID=A0A0N5BSE8_STREA